QQAPWGQWPPRLRALATAALREPDGVLATLAELEPMAPIGPIDLDEVQLVLGPRLRELTVPPARRRYGAVLVAPAEAARGLAFDIVFVPGLAEKLFPRKIVEDPILLDPHRRALEVPALATQPARVGAERLALRLAVGAARERVVLSWPRVDIEQARPRVPSFYGLEALRAASGRPPLLADRPPALRRLSVPLLPAGGHAAPAARGPGGDRGARPAHAWRALPRGPVRRPERAARRGAPPGPAREPRRGARGGRRCARHGGGALGREALAGDRPGVEGRHRWHPRRPARVAAARGGRGRRLGPVALRAVLRARRPRSPAASFPPCRRRARAGTATTGRSAARTRRPGPPASRRTGAPIWSACGGFRDAPRRPGGARSHPRRPRHDARGRGGIGDGKDD